jgi:hypothetical protein
MQAFVSPLSAFSSNASVNINLGFPRPFLAWITVTMVDSLIDFDRDNAVAADIFTVDGVRTPTRAIDGDHFGPLGSGANLFAGAFTGFGLNVLFFLRAPFLLNGNNDIAAHGEAIVLTLD